MIRPSSGRSVGRYPEGATHASVCTASLPVSTKRSARLRSVSRNGRTPITHDRRSSITAAVISSTSWCRFSDRVASRRSHGARPPGLVLVCEPDELGLERAHPQLALGARLVELAEADGHVAADDDRTPARLDENYLQAARMARRRDEAEPGQQLELAVDRLVAHAGRLDPLADRVVVLRERVLELLPLDVD